jgi:hypothetical protein
VQPLDQVPHGFSPERATEAVGLSVALSELRALGFVTQGLRASRLPLATFGRTFSAFSFAANLLIALFVQRPVN